jgi:hypothetical protein
MVPLVNIEMAGHLQNQTRLYWLLSRTCFGEISNICCLDQLNAGYMAGSMEKSWDWG